MAALTGRALVGLSALSNRSFNAVFRGDVLLADGRVVRAFVKDLDARQLANELFVSVLGTSLGVKMPRGGLVAVGSDVSTSFSKLPHVNGSDHVAYCSVDAGGSTIAQIISHPDQIASLTALKASPGLGWMYGFDTWVANIDRHVNNIVLSGDGSAYLIDHGHCFSGPRWQASELNSRTPYPNCLRSWLTPQLSVDERNRAMADVTKLIGRMAGIDVVEAIAASFVEQIYGETDCEVLLGFLEGRVEHVSAMTAESLEVLI